MSFITFSFLILQFQFWLDLDCMAFGLITFGESQSAISFEEVDPISTSGLEQECMDGTHSSKSY